MVGRNNWPSFTVQALEDAIRLRLIPAIPGKPAINDLRETYSLLTEALIYQTLGTSPPSNNYDASTATLADI